MTIKSMFDSIGHVRKDWREDWTETSKSDWKTDWVQAVATSIFFDTFTGTAGTPVVNHVADTGQSYSMTSGAWGSDTDLHLDGAGNIQCVATPGNGGSVVINSLSLADFEINVNFTILAGSQGAGIYLVGRASDDLSTSFVESDLQFVMTNGSLAVNLDLYDSGAFSQSLTDLIPGFVAAGAHVYTFTGVGGAVTVKLDGTTLSTGTTTVLSAGKIVYSMYQMNTSPGGQNSLSIQSVEVKAL